MRDIPDPTMPVQLADADAAASRIFFVAVCVVSTLSALVFSGGLFFAWSRWLA